MQNQQQFWTLVKKERASIAAKLQRAEIKGQPKYEDRLAIVLDSGKLQDDNPVYITSVLNYSAGTSEGSTVLTTVQSAGQRIIEQTHRLATTDEIEVLLEGQADVKKEIQDAEIRRKTQYQFTMAPVAAQVKASQVEKDAPVK